MLIIPPVWDVQQAIAGTPFFSARQERDACRLSACRYQKCVEKSCKLSTEWKRADVPSCPVSFLAYVRELYSRVWRASGTGGSTSEKLHPSRRNEHPWMLSNVNIRPDCWLGGGGGAALTSAILLRWLTWLAFYHRNEPILYYLKCRTRRKWWSPLQIQAGSFFQLTQQTDSIIWGLQRNRPHW